MVLIFIPEMLAKDQLRAQAIGFGVEQPWYQHKPPVRVKTTHAEVLHLPSSHEIMKSWKTHVWQPLELVSLAAKVQHGGQILVLNSTGTFHSICFGI